MTSSPFLAVPPSEWVAANALAFALRDRYPVSPGHTLVIPRRLVPTWFEATPEEQQALMALVEEVKRDLDLALRPDGYNVGFNAGPAAGQTVMHLHVHVIPRFAGDMDDPRGGVRHVIPSKGNYLLSPRPLATGGEDDPFARHLRPLLAVADQIDIVAAFVQDSGLDRIEADLDRAVDRGARVRLLTGDYLALTQASALQRLLDWQASQGPAEDDDGPTPPPADPARGAARGGLETRVIEVERLPGRTRSFHPKAWRFEGRGLGVAYVGSSNLSASALESGVEWNLRVERDRDAAAYRVKEAFERLWVRARALDPGWVAEYAAKARRGAALPLGEVVADEVRPPDPPHEVQQEALAELRLAREEGRRRALVVLATGLGKTWLAAYDYQQLWDERGHERALVLVVQRRPGRCALGADGGTLRLHDREPRPGPPARGRPRKGMQLGQRDLGSGLRRRREHHSETRSST
jgi:diadenosine tetraphosphate (Ap4A) HIT family hydrolase